MKKEMKGFILGVIITSMAMFCCNALAESKERPINAMLDSIVLRVNCKPQNINSILYKGTNYVPVRDMAEAMNADCEWKGSTNTISIFNKDISPRKYLEGKGYNVLSYRGADPPYTLSKGLLTSLPYMQEWGLQNIDMSPYLGQTVYKESFLVSNHSLDNWELKPIDGSKGVKSKGSVIVTLFIIDNKIVGGVSYPNIDVVLAGGGYSLEGRTLNQIYPNYMEWYNNWMKEYGQ